MIQLVNAFRGGALLVARSDLSTLEVVGPDRTSWLQAVLTNDLAPVSQGRGVYALSLNKKGKIVADLVVAACGETLLLSVHDTVAQEALDHLDRLLVMEDAEVRRRPEPLSAVHVVGPAAPSLLQAARRSDGLVAAVPALLAGHEGAALWFHAGAQDRFLTQVCSESANVRCTDAPTFDRVRPLLGWPGFPADFNPECYPQEAGLDDRAVSFTKGCYPGQELVVKMRSRGHPSRSLVRVVAPGEGRNQPWAAGTSVLDAAGAKLGVVTSAALLPDPFRLVAFAMLKWSQSNPGTSVRVDGIEGRLTSAWGLLDPPAP